MDGAGGKAANGEPAIAGAVEIRYSSQLGGPACVGLGGEFDFEY